jgi:hypothetical protein
VRPCIQTPVLQKEKRKEKKKNNNCCCGELGTLMHCWWEFKMMQVLWKTFARFLKTLNIKLACKLPIQLLITYPK